MSAGMILLWGSGGTFDARGEKGVCTDAPDRNCFNLGAGTSLQLSVVACRALSMASATPAADVPSQSTALDFHLSCWVAERRRRGERICRSWPPKHHSNCSVRVMLVTQTGDKVVYHVGRSKGRARTQTARGGPNVADAVIEATQINPVSRPSARKFGTQSRPSSTPLSGVIHARGTIFPGGNAVRPVPAGQRGVEGARHPSDSALGTPLRQAQRRNHPLRGRQTG
jgi:hypothetical protein